MPHPNALHLHLLRRCAAWLVALWLLACLGLWLGQRWLLFPGAPAPIGQPVAPGVTVHDVSVRGHDDAPLRGWLARPEGVPDNVRLPLILYFGGKNEDTSARVSWPAKLPGWALLTVPFRGYGPNPGPPSEAALCADALALFDQAAARPDVDPGRIVAVGYSVGSGIAVHVAASRPVWRSVLLTPYDSIANVAARRFPFVPVHLLLNHPLDSVARAPGIEAPVLVLAAKDDIVIPPPHTARLVQALGQKATVFESTTTDHNTILNDPEVWLQLRAWLQVTPRPL